MTYPKNPDKYFPRGIEEEVDSVTRIRRYFGQLVMAVFMMAFIGYFSQGPNYTYLEPGNAIIKLSISIPGEKKEACRKRTREELQKLAPNMRAPMSCGRERVPVSLELLIDDKIIYSETQDPKGFSKDGASIFYKRLVYHAGVHNYQVRLRNSHRAEGFDHVQDGVVDLAEGQNFVITFKEELGKFRMF
ncbi:MAG: hypothetical protein OQJ99_01690 [Rhodospirillales bacterium]|nr:hypothetical protein [Rhodospirillales bacterium]MCW8862557.1 hypothetical protein [Rhodospirillales bacterium]MCW8951461.1 hypothetical protein [Rhodospirillales bacterium]MCW8970137.1 hypothetical protein [Rhodospirillales bacterium]MCW9001190.1 hypothetical protein [Rhodospirillales bacterium]